MGVIVKVSSHLWTFLGLSSISLNWRCLISSRPKETSSMYPVA
ncbi:hypothetical protein AB205_0062560 [Aquarana catesbeiana]|uniref:Uncharacterized protein n=1 Tax=Aquarana catesbeiana TaxID=8400 RepID=A0A2G9QBR0_AQUCT|nr:hypothetical protein AB205_0062560 [Aquarana catesbeiana]